MKKVLRVLAEDLRQPPEHLLFWRIFFDACLYAGQVRMRYPGIIGDVAL
jgi:hypothetical protein